MSNQKTLLISLLVTTAAIGLVETNLIQFNKESIHAQQDIRNLVLERDGEKVTIPSGDWIVAVNAWDPEIYTGGELLGISGEGVLIKEPKKDIETNITYNDIGIIYHGEYKSVWKYTKQGLKIGGLAAVAGGLFFGVLCVTVADEYASGNSFIENFGLGFFGGTYITGIFTVPSGAVIGLFEGLVKKEQASEFVIGPNDWQIVQ